MDTDMPRHVPRQGAPSFRYDPGRTLRHLDKLRADLRVAEKWQRGESAKGYSCKPDDPELKIRHQELTEEIEH